MWTRAFRILAALTVVAGCSSRAIEGSDEEAGDEQAFSITSTLANGQHRPTQMAVDATHVYWAVYRPADDAVPFVKHYDVLRVAKTGGPVQVLASTEVEITSLTVDDTHVYWLNQSDDCGQSTERKGAARRVVKNGSAPAESIGGATACADFKGITNGQLVVDAKNIYFSGDLGVRMLPKDGSAGVSLFAEAGPNPHASTKSSVLLLQDETTIFYGDSYGPAYAKAKAPLGAAAVKILDEAPWEAGIDATHLYWVKDGKVMRVAKPTSGAPSAPQEVGPAGFNHISAIVVDAEDVYYSNTVTKAIRRIKKTGAAASRLFASNETAHALAIDGTSLFFPHYGIEYMDFMVPGYVAKSGTIRKRTLR